VKALFCPTIPNFREGTAFWMFPGAACG